MRLRIHRPKQGAVIPEVGYVGECADGAALSGGGWGKGRGAGLEGSLSRLKQVRFYLGWAVEICIFVCNSSMGFGSLP